MDTDFRRYDERVLQLQQTSDPLIRHTGRLARVADRAFARRSAGGMRPPGLFQELADVLFGDAVDAGVDDLRHCLVVVRRQ
jgi:hypothetical protein